MNKPNERVLQALTALEHNHDFAVVVEWLQACRESARDDTEQAADPHVIAVAQGESRALSTLLRTIKNARETLRKTG